MLTRLKHRYVADRVPANLPGYRQPVHPWLQKARDRLAVSALIVFGLFVGVFVSILPVFMYVYLAAPFGVLFLLVIWALPETGRFQEKFINRAIWCFFVSVYLWPNYLAIDVAGLPWITVQRFFLIPLAVIFMIGASQSTILRSRVVETYQCNVITFRLFIAFVAIQVICSFFSPTISQGFNKFTNNQLVWTLLFLASCATFRTKREVEKWAMAIVFLCMILAVIAFLEVRNQGVLWADHIPSFLQADAGERASPMAPSYRHASNLYRVKGTFSNPLLLAELLGLSTPFVLYAIASAKKRLWQAVFVIYLPAHFMAIRYTDGRLGVVSFFGSILIYGLFWGIRYRREHPGQILGPAIILSYPAAAIGLGILTLTWTPLYRAVLGGGAQEASNEGRRAQWIAAIPKLEAWPFGRGPGSSGEVLNFAGAGGVLTVDSYYITLLLEYGIIGFIVYLVMFGSAATTAMRRYLQPGGSEVFLPLGTMLILFIVDKSVLSLDLIHPLLFMAMAAILSLNTTTRSITGRS